MLKSSVSIPFVLALFLCPPEHHSVTMDFNNSMPTTIQSNDLREESNTNDHPVIFRQNKSSSSSAAALPVRKENSRFLNIFSIIDIPNTACQSSHKPLRELNGTCYHPNQCAKLGGLGNGKCADGFGVCCFCKYKSWSDLVAKGGKIIPNLSKFPSPSSSIVLRGKDGTGGELLWKSQVPCAYSRKVGLHFNRGFTSGHPTSAARIRSHGIAAPHQWRLHGRSIRGVRTEHK